MPQAVLGYAAKAVGAQLEPFTYEPPKLNEYDIRVSVTHCGLCFTDIHAIDDYYGITTYPFVPGHEIVGYVTEAGPAATGLKKGDRVGIGWQGRSCMRCESCLRGEEHLCLDVVDNGVWFPYGGFSSSVTADSRFAYLLPDAMPPETAAALMCAGITVYSPLRSNSAGSLSKVGVIGVGGLGHLAIQFAHALGCDVTAFSSSPEKREEALGFGANDFILTSDKASIDQKYKDRKLRLDLLLYTTHAKTDWTYLFNIMKRKGIIVMMGFSSVPVEFEPTDLVVHELSISGSFVGSRAAMREMLSFAQAKGIKPKIELMPMTQVNEAIHKVKENKARYRVVLTNQIGSS
jgi:uncharacterized zinc-type alcohol dehydrogenase-like protein